jgi:hypothetical protein
VTPDVIADCRRKLEGGLIEVSDLPDCSLFSRSGGKHKQAKQHKAGDAIHDVTLPSTGEVTGVFINNRSLYPRLRC